MRLKLHNFSFVCFIQYEYIYVKYYALYYAKKKACTTASTKNTYHTLWPVRSKFMKLILRHLRRSERSS